MKESLEEDYFTDPVTGRKITLEEAENGAGIHLEPTPDYPTDKYIEANYREEDREIEYVKRAIGQKLFKFIDEEEYQLEAKHLFSKYNEFIPTACAEKKSSQIIIAHTTTRTGRAEITEYILALRIESKNPMGHTLIWPADTADLLKHKLGDTQLFSPGKIYCVMHLSPPAPVTEKIIAALDSFSDLTGEIIDKSLYIKSNMAASRES